MDQEKYPARIRYEYEEDKKARLQYAHGVWGGINPQGEIEINFYVEGDRIPAYSERMIAPDGSFGHEMAPHDENVRTIVRRVHSRVIVSYQTARALLNWLEDKVDALDAESGGTPSIIAYNEPENGGLQQ